MVKLNGDLVSTIFVVSLFKRDNKNGDYEK